MMSNMENTNTTVVASTINEQEFARVKAIAELALRRTTGLTEQLAANEANPITVTHGTSVDSSFTRADMDKLKASNQQLSARILYLEDKIETLNALTLATRNQTQTLSASMEDNPIYKSIHLKLFENEMTVNELGDKIKLLAHIIQNQSAGGGGEINQRTTSTTNSTQSKPIPSSPTRTSAPSLSSTRQLSSLPASRSLVSTLAADENSSKTQHPVLPDGSDSEDDIDRSHHASRQSSISGGPNNTNTTKATYGTTIPTTHEEMAHPNYTDQLDERQQSLNMVLRDSHLSQQSLEQVTKDLKALGTMQEKLATIESLDSKLASISSLESKVDSLLDLDLKERLTFIERRFNTELTFLRSHVNTKVDASSLKVLLDKMEIDQQLLPATLTHPPQTASAGGRGQSPNKRHDDLSGRGQSSGGEFGTSDIHGNSMARTSGRDTRARAANEVDRVSRDRKQRLAHLLTMLDKKADHSSIRSVEEFVRSIDRHLRSLIARHTQQFKQLEANGLLVPMKSNKKDAAPPKPMSQLPDQESKVDHPDPSGPYHESDEWTTSEPEIEYGVPQPDEPGTIPTHRRPQPIHDSTVALEAEAAARMGITISNSNGQLAQLQRTCDDLQLQIASLHAALAKKEDRSTEIDQTTVTKSSSHLRQSSTASIGSGSGSGSIRDVELSHSPPASFDGLCLNPTLSLISHPHITRLVTRIETLEHDLSHTQSLVMYQSKQLRNHREWIAKHSRELVALRQYVKYAQTQQQVNGQTRIIPNGGTQVIPSESSIATSAAYPSPAVYQLLRQVEADISSLRRSLKQKIDFMDLGIANPHDQSQALPITAATNYPHPSLEDLRRLIYYLTPQLNSGGPIPTTGPSLTGTDAHTHRVSSMLTTKGVHHVPPFGATTHPSHSSDETKCLSCDRPLDTISTTIGPKVSRHLDLTSSLNSVAPAGGTFGSNTRRLVTTTNPTTFFASSTRSHDIHPRPPANAHTVSGPITPRSAVRAQAITLAQQDTKEQVTSGSNSIGSIPSASDQETSTSERERVAEKANRKAEKQRKREKEKAEKAQADLEQPTKLPSLDASAQPPPTNVADANADSPSAPSPQTQPTTHHGPSRSKFDLAEVVELARQNSLKLGEQQQQDPIRE